MKEEYSLKKYLATFFRLWPMPEGGYVLTAKRFKGTMSHAYDYGGGGHFEDFEAAWGRMTVKPTGKVRLNKAQMTKMLTQFYQVS
jgi:hypothetical protein